MERPSRRDLRGPWRRGLFWAWVAASAAVALYVGLAGPFAHYLGEGRSFVALAVPALMFFMLLSGFGWLVLFVLARPTSRSDDGP